MADYKSAYSTSLGDYCKAKGIKEGSHLEIRTILAIGGTSGLKSEGAYLNAIMEFNRLAESYDDVVDLREGIVTQKQTGVFNLIFGLHDSVYHIRGTALKKK